MMGWLIRMFCRHSWRTHATREYERIETFFESYKDATRETLICDKCGAIKHIIH